ncbi:SUMF1/EgtB/PvdO family nonheme iron enzyme [Streptomyces sp. NPDC057654]|uniref:SUMF1/EgtB/PvdO family nonheme iron enzyme n=1 Tax=Streptomyces sp. NPDC057654 TaxID=3346196 RepID=UPI0036BB86C8
MVVRWTGRETRALREVQRLTVRQFAAHIGVSSRTVTKWERSGTTPRPLHQAALDTLLSCASAAVQERFATLITEQAASATDPRTETLLASGARQHRTHPMDGKLMVLVAPGMYLAGEKAERRWVPEFWIDVFPTTNADYARYTRATDSPAPEHWSGGRCPDAIFNHPVVWVSWDQASAYAAWAGKALPTSEQWEKAARGPSGGVYPWGSAATAAKCNVRESGIGHTTPVSRYHSGVSPYGVYDLCGNTWEWCSTESGNGRHELKGGAFTSPFDRAAPAAFNDAVSAMTDDDTGFRCVTADDPAVGARPRQQG